MNIIYKNLPSYIPPEIWEMIVQNYNNIKKKVLLKELKYNTRINNIVFDSRFKDFQIYEDKIYKIRYHTLYDYLISKGLITQKVNCACIKCGKKFFYWQSHMNIFDMFGPNDCFKCYKKSL